MIPPQQYVISHSRVKEYT